jgi:hypothetical protein
MRRKLIMAALTAAAVFGVGLTAMAAPQPSGPTEQPNRSHATDEPTGAFEDPNTEEEFQMSQDSDGPAPTRAQFALGRAITERLLTPDWRSPDPDGMPPELFKGVIGVYGSPGGGYTLVLGRGTAANEVTTDLLDGLPAGAADGLTVVKSHASADEFLAAWRDVRAHQDLGLASLGVDAKVQKIVVGIHPSTTTANADRLRALSPLLTVKEMHVSRLPGRA